jgi:hypothetical protein
MAHREPRYPRNAFTSAGEYTPADWARGERGGSTPHGRRDRAIAAARGLRRFVPIIALLLVVWQISVSHDSRGEGRLWDACCVSYDQGARTAVSLLNEFLAIYPDSEHVAGARRRLETLAALGGNMPVAPPAALLGGPATVSAAGRRSYVDVARAEAWIIPCTGRVVEGYGVGRHPTTGRVRFHEGIDLQAANALIVASRSGVVVHSGDDQDRAHYGAFVVIDHGDDQYSLYANTSHILV